MTIHHHLNEATLLSYASGSVSESESLVIATHLSLCADCREKAREMEAIGGIELENMPAMDMDSRALQDILMRLDDIDSHTLEDAANDSSESEIPQPLRALLPATYDDVPWKVMAPGIKSHALSDVKSGEGSIRLLKIAPGMTIPEHGHSGPELTLVLKGSFSDEIGRFKAGDIADLDQSCEHQPIADTHEDCICLIATQGPLQFKSVVPKIVQYFTKM